MFNQLSEVESRFNTLKERAGKLAAFESSGLKQTLDSFQKTLNNSKGVKQSNATVATLGRALNASITQVEGWLEAEEKEQVTFDQDIKALQARLSRTKQLLIVKRADPQAAEAELKYANDAIEKSRIKPDDAARQSDLSSSTPMAAFGIKAAVENEVDLTLLKGQLGALEIALLQASRNLEESRESARKNSARIKNLRGQISKLTPGTPAMEAEIVRLGEILIEIQPFIESLPESPEAPVDIDENGSFYGTAFLDAMKAGQGVTGFYKKAKEASDSHELTALKAENTKLKTQLIVVQSENETLTTEKAELIDDLARELDEGTKLSVEVTSLKDSLAVEQGRVEALTTENTGLYETNASNQKVAREINAQKVQAEKDIAELTTEYESEKKMSEQLFEQNRKVIKENERLVENLDEEGKRYLARETELLNEIEKAKSKTVEATAQIAQHQHEYSTLESRLRHCN